MPSAERSQKVLIIGGGPAGLALGQTLRKAGVDYEVFERDVNDHSRKQGWAVTIRESIAGMKTLFSDDMPHMESKVTSIKGSQSWMGIFDWDSGAMVQEIRDPGESDMKRHFTRADRGLLKNWLQHNLNISWDKKFTHYDETDSGVTAHFADGTSATGDIIIACDGAHSRIRSQLLGEEAARPQFVPIGSASAEMRLEKAEFEQMLAKGSAFHAARTSAYQWFATPRTIETEDDLKNTNFSWSVIFQDEKALTEGEKHWTQTCTGEEMLKYALDATKSMHPSLRALVEKTTPDQMVTPALRLLEWVPKTETLGGKRVTLIGDAMHTMTPFQGAGANTAILDALDLGQLLIRANKKGEDFTTVIEPYERIAVPRGQANMTASHQSGTNADKWKREVKGRIDAGYEWKPMEE